MQAHKLLVINQTTGWHGRRHMCLCSHSVKCVQAGKGNGYEFFQFGRKILTSSKIKDCSVMLVACLLSSDPRLWGMLEDTERWLRHTAGARNGTYTCQIHRTSLALTETQFLPALMIIYHTATRLWRQFLLFIEQLIILVTDLLQEKLRVSVCHKTLKYHSWTSWGSGFELTARQRTESILFFSFWIKAQC